MRSQTFIIPGKPNTNHRPRSGSSIEIERVKKADKNGVMRETRNQILITAKSVQYMDNDYDKYKDLVAKCAIESGIDMYERCRIFIIDHLPMNGTKHKKKRNVVSEPLLRPDLDNLKAIKDGLKGIAFKDDKHALWEQPQVAYGGMNADRYVKVTITECHWTEFITDEGKQWCEDANYEIPYPEGQNE